MSYQEVKTEETTERKYVQTLAQRCFGIKIWNWINEHGSYPQIYFYPHPYSREQGLTFRF